MTFYTALKPSALKEHVETERRGLRYKCDLCDCTVKLEGSLKTHKESVHDEKIKPIKLLRTTNFKMIAWIWRKSYVKIDDIVLFE